MMHDQVIDSYFMIMPTNLSINHLPNEYAHGLVVTVLQLKTVSINGKNHQSMEQRVFSIGLVPLALLKILVKYINVSTKYGWMDDRKNVDASNLSRNNARL